MSELVLDDHVNFVLPGSDLPGLGVKNQLHHWFPQLLSQQPLKTKNKNYFIFDPKSIV